MIIDVTALPIGPPGEGQVSIWITHRGLNVELGKTVTPDEARELAGRLNAAADAMERWNAGATSVEYRESGAQ